MRPAVSLASVPVSSALASRRGGWAGRLALAALLFAISALVLMPDTASAHHTPDTTYGTHCQAVDGNVGDMMQDIVSDDMVSDCIALLKAGERLTVGDDTSVNWLQPTNQFLDILAPRDMGASSWDGIGIEEIGVAPNQRYRITGVDLNNEDLGGRLASEWADLSALTSLDLSGNNLEGTIPAVWGDENDGFQALTALDLSDNDLSGTVPHDVWVLLDGLETLNLDDNKDLRPSPPLNLGARASKTANGEPQVTLSFHAVWYTLEVPRHEYRYSADGGATWGPNTAAGSEGWMSDSTGCTDSGGPRLCSKDNGADPPGRNTVAIESDPLPKSDTYVFQVRAVKETPYTDDKGTPDDTSDDTEETRITRSQVSQINVVGPQVLTAESDFLLELGARYSVAEPLPDASVLVVESADNGLQFTPKAATGDDDVIVHLTQASSEVTSSNGAVIGRAGGAVSFPVEIKPASTAPTKRDIPNRTIMTLEKPTRIDLTDRFQGEELTYTAESSRPAIATVAIDQETGELLITAIRNGVTSITVTATNPDRGKATITFRVTVSLPNDPPEAIGAVPDQTLFLDDAGTHLDMTGHFRDPDRDRLRLIPQSSNPMVVTATSNGNVVTFNVVGLGEASMTVIAEDPNGETAFITFKVSVLPPNEAPEAVGPIPAQTLRLGDDPLTLDLTPYFTDPNGDPLTFAAESADESIVTAEATESAVAMTAVGVGETSVTVTATDPWGESATLAVAVTVLPGNRPPEAVGSIGDQVLVVGGHLLTIDVAEFFNDPDGDALAYTATSSDQDAVQAVIIGDSSSLVLKPLAPSEGVTITVTASDPDGESAKQTFTATALAGMTAATPAPTATPAPAVVATPTQTPEPPASPTPAPTATPEPSPTSTPVEEDGGGPPLGLILLLLLVVVAAAVLIIQRRRGPPPAEG